MLTQKTYQTRCGTIRYWTQHKPGSRYDLVFLPGLTADHRLFEKQLAHFKKNYTVLVWDAPGHAASYPFGRDFNLMDKATWLKEILDAEQIQNPVIIGQSMGGYVAQAFMQRFPGRLKGFVSIDSAPLQRSYMTAAELWPLKRMEPVYRYYPWKALLKSGSAGCATTEYGRALMREMMMTYDGRQARYAKLSGDGFKMLAEAIEADLPYKIGCPALLLCGDKDVAGFTKRYNRAWHQKTGIPLIWIRGAGHNSNTDRPARVNAEIDKFLNRL